MLYIEWAQIRKDRRQEIKIERPSIITDTQFQQVSRSEQTQKCSEGSGYFNALLHTNTHTNTHTESEIDR